MISNSRLLIEGLQRLSEQIQYSDFETEFITVELDEKEYLIDGLCMRQTASDPVMRHICIKLKEPQDIGGGIIR